MRTINIHQAKTHLSRLVDEAEQGEPFIIAKAGKPKVMVTPITRPHEPKQRRIGFMKGMFTLPENYEQVDQELDKEIANLMLGEASE
ncbi:MAG: type II toxin-antitoxin system prevent-host-death family antitoxin [Terracidiphilus sp.]|jgi:prevent-host-death family protein